MKSNIKKLIVGLTVLLAIALYPLSSIGKSDNKNSVTLNSDNLVILNGEVTPESVAATITSLRELDNKASRMGRKDPIYLFLYTPGGDIQAGLELIEAVQGMNRPVNTITLFAASMGFQIVQNLGDRLILKNGILMSHRAYGGFEGFFGGQAPSQIDNRYALWLQRVQELDEQTVKRTKGKQTLESYRKEYANEMWKSGKQSVEEGYADMVVTAHCDKTLKGNDSHDIIYLGMPVHYETSRCPLITSLLNIKIGGDQLVMDSKLVERIKGQFVNEHDYANSVK